MHRSGCKGTTRLLYRPEHPADLEHIEPAHRLLQAWELVKGHRQHACSIVVPAKLVSSIELIAWGLEAHRPAERDRLDGAGRIQGGCRGPGGPADRQGRGRARGQRRMGR
jgi:hypothetical protein